MTRPRPRTGDAGRLPAPLAERLELRRLENGMRVGLLPDRRAPLVSTALCYLAGGRDERRRLAGLGHFLEHMMFKGSQRYGPGEIDRRTQALGGSNNAFTGHDCTVYYFDFASDRWTEALDVEADRMLGLTLAADEVDAERAVILEEIAMYESDPWDALERRVEAAYFGAHPYGRAILGTPEGLAASGAAELAEFHRRMYRPGNAVLVLAGDLDAAAFDEVESRFAALPSGAPRRRALPGFTPAPKPRRLERRKGEVARLLLALPGPAATHPDYAPLRLLLTVLAGGRASRLQRVLVEEDQLCASVAADASERQGPGMVVLALEAIPGVEPATVEERLLAELACAAEAPLLPAEVARARRLLVADRVFAHERVRHQAVAAAVAVALFDVGYPDRHLAEILDCGPDRLLEVARRYLRPGETGVTGWSLPEARERRL